MQKKLIFIFTMILIYASIFSQEKNTWQKVGENIAGYRSGSAIVWLEDEQKFLIIGGTKNDKWTKESGIP